MRGTNSIDYLLDKATNLLFEQRNKEALIICDEVLKIDPKQMYAHNFKAVIYSRLGRYRDGVNSIDQALKYSNDDLRLEQLPIKVELLCNSGKYDEALKVADKAVKEGLDPSSIAFLRGLSLHRKFAETMSDDIAKQILSYYTDALKTEPNRYDISDNIGKLLSDRNRHEEALKYFDHALSIKPKKDTILIDKAVALYETGRRKEATKYCREIIKLDSRDAQVQYKLSYVLCCLGLAHEALDAINTASSIDPLLPNHESIRKLIKSVLDSTDT